MTSYNLTALELTPTNAYVYDEHFGANALHSVNTNGVDFSPSEGFQSAIEDLSINHLRYPGGHVESTLNVLRLENGSLRAEIVAFFDWCMEKRSSGEDVRVTFVLPTKTDINSEAYEEFVYLLLREYGEVIEAFEIGNEYSIGPSDPNADRSIHPENIYNQNFAYAQNEIQYAIAANQVIDAVQSAIHQLDSESPLRNLDPKILVQMAETNGAASSFKGSGDYSSANEWIVSWLSDSSIEAIDGVVAHYYYNKNHVDDQSFSHTWDEVRRLDERYDDFVSYLGKDVPMYITEWNVLVGNHNQTGMASASVLVEMFDFMIGADVSATHIWPLQHRTINNLMGDREDPTSDPSISGTMFAMMSESMRPVESQTGIAESFQRLVGDWSGYPEDIEINQFGSQYHSVFYVSSRSLSAIDLSLDLSMVCDAVTSVTINQLTMERSSSDGLSDFADETGGNRVSRRIVTEEEMLLLEALPFFDPENKNHISIDSSGTIRTYLPSYWSIVPLIDNPRQVEDYYFATEADVDPLILSSTLSPSSLDDIQLSFFPYDVVEILVQHSWIQQGSNGSDRLVGGHLEDIIHGLGGDDFLRGGESRDRLDAGAGNDTIYGGADGDVLIGGTGSDLEFGELGNDTFYSGSGDDTILGGEGSDIIRFGLEAAEVSLLGVSQDQVTLLSSDGVDVIGGVEFFDFDGQVYSFSSLNNLSVATSLSGTIEGDLFDNMTSAVHIDSGLGADEIYTAGFSDTIFSGGGEDYISSGRGDDYIDSGDGRDNVHAMGGNDTVYSGYGSDTVKGGMGSDVINGGEGLDLLLGQRGNDTLSGGIGDDRIKGGGDNDLLLGEDGRDFLKGGGGDDSLKGHFGDDTVSGNRGNDTVNGGWGHDILRGGGGDDTLMGGGGDDSLKGGEGQDFLAGGSGNDILVGGDGADVFHFSEDFGRDEILDFSFGHLGDVLDLGEVEGISSFDNLIDNHMLQFGSDVLISDGNGNTIQILQTSIAEFSEDSFLF